MSSSGPVGRRMSNGRSRGWCVAATLVVSAAAAAGCSTAAPADPAPTPPSAPAPAPSATDAPPPPAADGTDTGACADGTCQILVTGSIAFSAAGYPVTATVRDGSATVSADYPGGGSGNVSLSGSGSSGSLRGGDGPQVTVTMTEATPNGAVLDFRSTP